jgi:hypothetical protein
VFALFKIAASADGARIYFRNTSTGVEILGYSHKNNQKIIIQ